MGSSWTFNYTGAAQSWTAPAGGWYAVELQGGAGGNGFQSGDAAPTWGKGALITGRVFIEAGTIATIYVPGALTAFGGYINVSAYGYHSGGTGGNQGGGSAAILLGGVLLAEAGGGGGGGAGLGSYGGFAGGNSGLVGSAGSGSAPGGGATGSVDGSGGGNGSAGSSGTGGAGGAAGTGYAGGGGGGGYRGGGGGGKDSTDASGGGGGSSFTAGNLIAVEVTNAYASGLVVIRQVPGSIVTII